MDAATEAKTAVEESQRESRRKMEEHGEVIQRTVRATPRDVGGMEEHLAVLIEEEQEIAETRFMLTLAQNRN